MRKLITIIYCLSCVLFTTWAVESPSLNSSDANIYGHVIDKEFKEHMAGVTIFLKGTTIGTTTDDTGHYYLKNLPEGTFTVVMKYIGFKTMEKKV